MLSEKISINRYHIKRRIQKNVTELSSRLRVVAYLVAAHVTNLSVAQTTHKQMVRHVPDWKGYGRNRRVT